MTTKTLLACLTTQEHAAAVLGAAVPLARRHGAHLVGLHTLEALEIYPGIAVHVSAEVFSAFNAEQHRQAEAIRDIFESFTAKEDFVSEYRLLQSQSKTAADRMIESARAADLVMMAQADGEVDRYDQRYVQSAVIRHAGRPVIVVPNGYDGPPIGSRILVGWSDTREAARAAHDVLPLAAPGAEFTLLRVTSGASDEMKDADLLDLSTALARHGHNVNVRHTEIGAGSIADVLLRIAFEEGSDLIATGAFGHSTAYDFVLGATTTALLKAANRPVLFSK